VAGPVGVAFNISAHILLTGQTGQTYRV